MKTIFSMWGLLIAIVLTLFAVILALNFTTGEKKIERRVERLYTAGDPAFARAMGVLLGPAILEGNRFEALLNGDRIFPAKRGVKLQIIVSGEHSNAADFARQQVDVFNADLSRSRRISLHEWQQRPLVEKFLGHAASLIGAQL